MISVIEWDRIVHCPLPIVYFVWELVTGYYLFSTITRMLLAIVFFLLTFC